MYEYAEVDGCMLKIYNVIATELYYSWNRNTAVLLYNLLSVSGQGERKWLAHMFNPYIIIPYDAIYIYSILMRV